MNILVTGASGFLGVHLVRALLAQGHQVRALVLPCDSAPALRRMPVTTISGDVLEPDTLSAACESCDAVIHGAGKTNLRIAGRKRLFQLHTEGTKNVCQAARANQVRRLIYISSLGVLGGHHTPRSVSVDQPAPNAQTQKNTYHRAKVAAEKIAFQFASSSLDVISVLPGMLWGPEDYTLSSTGLIPLFMRSATMLVPTTGGTNILDVADAAQGITCALTRGQAGKRYLLAGDNITNREMFERLRQAANPAVRLKSVPLPMITLYARIAELLAWLNIDLDFSMDTRRLIDAYWWADGKLAEKELGFERKYTLEQTIERTVAWHRENNI